MTPPNLDVASIIFVLALVGTFAAAGLGRLHSRRQPGTALVDQRLNRWLIGLSAGATANSGFVVTGAVGLGYVMGAQWIILPLAWWLGDLVFWSLFPHRINRRGEEARANTLSDVLVAHLPPASRIGIKRLVGVVILLCLGGYVAAQWVAGQKFVYGAFGIDELSALFIFAGVIIAYTAIGGFRGSVYADSFQAVLRVFSTILALVAVVWVAGRTPDFAANIALAGPAFLDPFPQATLGGSVAFVLGFAAASLGFGLGQPQVFTRYLAGSSPTETRSAWWIYMGFVQFTWIAMTVFGMYLRGVMPTLDDPEAGLSVFFRASMGPILTGLIAADIFATIAATSNSLLVVMSQTVRFDIFGRVDATSHKPGGLWAITALLGVLTMTASVATDSSVFALAITSVGLLGAGLAPAMGCVLFGWRPSVPALALTVLAGFTTAGAWVIVGLSGVANEALPGIAVGLVVAFLSSRVFPSRRAHPD